MSSNRSHGFRSKPAEKMVRREPTTTGVDLKLVHPRDKGIKTDLDIIAIHGLGTKSPDTWEFNNAGKGNKSTVNWLEDEDMLPSLVGDASIWTCDWPSKMFQDSDSAKKRIDEIARQIVSGIARRLPPSDNNDHERPIFFIASCLGGIILMKALADSMETDPIWSATRGIIFLATPFNGTAFAQIEHWALPALSAKARIQGKKPTELPETLVPAWKIREIVRGFTMLQRRYNYLHCNFYEKKTTNLYSKNLPSPLNKIFKKNVMLVDDCSGILATTDRDPVSLNRAHTRMNKFPGPEDSDYKLVADAVTSYLETIRKGRPLEELERLLREWHYTAENLQIQRLNKDFLPMDRCYINLAIAEQIGEEKNISKQNGRVKPSSEFSFAARLVETPDEDIQVEIPNIFQARTGQDPPKKVLIRGRAGVGKTTLCKKIVHDFVYGDLWKCHFDLIFWLPLRRLKMLHHVNTRSIRDVIANEYLSRVYTDEDLAYKAWGAMHTSDYRKTLFLLDGLDEVSDMLKGDIPIIRDLLNLPNVIVTSRPMHRFRIR